MTGDETKERDTGEEAADGARDEVGYGPGKSPGDEAGYESGKSNGDGVGERLGDWRWA